MNKEIKKIFIVLALFAVSAGTAYNFQELWMADNNLSIKTISTVLSICALISCSTIFICSNIIKEKTVKRFTVMLLFIKALILLALFLLNNSGLNILIKFLIMIDFVLNVEIYASIYPLISMITKSDKIYAIRGLIYDTAFFAASIIITIILGKTILIHFTYNTYLIIASLLLIIASIILHFVNIDKYIKKSNKIDNNDILIRLLKKIKKDKISVYYLIFSFLGSTAFYTITGISMLILVTKMSYPSKMASSIILGMGILSAILGVIILSKLTLKNNYINIGIKYIIRVVLYLIAGIFTTKYTILIALLYTLLTSSIYTHVTDAPYINRFDSKEQLAFANLIEMIGYLSRALGVLLCGLLVVISLKFNFLLAAFINIFAVIFSYYALYLRNREVKK